MTLNQVGCATLQHLVTVALPTWEESPTCHECCQNSDIVHPMHNKERATSIPTEMSPCHPPKALRSHKDEVLSCLSDIACPGLGTAQGRGALVSGHRTTWQCPPGDSARFNELRACMEELTTRNNTCHFSVRKLSSEKQFTKKGGRKEMVLLIKINIILKYFLNTPFGLNFTFSLSCSHQWE